MKTEKEIEAMLGKLDSDVSKYQGMTYEAGLETAWQWVLGEISDDDMEASL